MNALITVSDKRGVLSFARSLRAAGFSIISTGGTADHLRDGGVEVVEVSEITGMPELLDGRVKTLHPLIHGGVLARPDRPDDRAEIDAHDIPDIRLVVANLYPFEETVRSRGDAPLDDHLEMIDIGGPTLLRAAAKNHPHRTVVCDPADYEAVAEAFSERDGAGVPSRAMRRRLALKAFRHTARYDAGIVEYLEARVGSSDEGGGDDEAGDELPETWPLGLTRTATLRYGENPHQAGALYETPLAESFGGFEKLHGKALSYNNLVDLDAALQLVAEFDRPAAALIKHTNPAGCAVGETLERAYIDALACDRMSAFGGIAALTRPVDATLAERLHDHFWEVIAAPNFDEAALEILTGKKNVRLVKTPETLAEVIRTVPRTLRATLFGVVVQTADPRVPEWDDSFSSDRNAKEGGQPGHLAIPTDRAPSREEWRALSFNWRVCKHVKSNAIVLGRENRTIGVGAGQMSRVDAVKFAVAKARAAGHDAHDNKLAGAVLASDAFFPFRDGIDAAREAGVTAIVQPGGSRRDPEVIEACDEHGIAMVMTGRRHFRH